MSQAAYFLEPLDVLVLRGNKLFGDAGSVGESLVPPWPSVAAGALRSHLLACDRVDLQRYARGDQPHPALGTPAQPGPFTLTAFHLARRMANGRVEPLFAPPADLVLSPGEESLGEARNDGDRRCPPKASRMLPQALGHGIAVSCPLPKAPVLAQAQRIKPEGGWWLSASGWRAYLAGSPIPESAWVEQARLWKTELRVGVGLDASRGAAEDHRLFSSQAVAMTPGVGFLAAVTGATLPAPAVVRFGGDGHPATLTAADAEWPIPDYDHIARAGRCRMVLTTPGLFPQGWLPTGSGTPDATRGAAFELHGIRGRIVCSAVPRSEVVSGWNLATQQPRPAQRVAPAGSVYWLELEPGTTAEALAKLADQGLWSSPCEDDERRVQGFNRFCFAVY
ncbi:type III-B CRISPR module-associated Cmr3 family protein [Rehaibacterium terrae]|jgi:CRISPR-associated protein Cmr3|uniref:CRISPR-associated protein Cmr3 n=1 Tax=Rehaibacterium terrae TaxID=1341696 RepID=A0A7W8DEW2_9GAMM|nr:type III-B CRISPR module-associated Cmr3 family protein [Rehaibacterium terrae]MBB5015885.1 CRISPR-associated protein Cmr3 [Rehaibacterium terrae]